MYAAGGAKTTGRDCLAKKPTAKREKKRGS